MSRLRLAMGLDEVPEPEGYEKSAVFWIAVGSKLAGEDEHSYYARNRSQRLQAAARYRAANRANIARSARAYRKQVAVGSRHVRSRTTVGNRYVFGNPK